jgi:hypothetical protein
MYERRGQPILSRRAFAMRIGRSAAVSTALIATSLGVGIIGYRLTAGLSWIDALLNAAMILTGMGPVSPLHTDGAKVFASLYALFSGVVFIASAGVVVAPLAHRFLHRFHIELGDGQNEADGDREGSSEGAGGAGSQGGAGGDRKKDRSAASSERPPRPPRSKTRPSPP